MKRLWKRGNLIALFITVLMLAISITPMLSALSEGKPSEPGGADIIGEDVSKREAFTRHYLTGDGTYFAVSYTEQVNYLDENGRWQAVDNSFTTDFFTGRKTTRNEVFNVSFVGKADKPGLVSVRTPDYAFSWDVSLSRDGETYTSPKAVKPTATESAKAPTTTMEATSLGNAISGIKYTGAFGDGTDIEYSVAHEKIKENILLAAPGNYVSHKVTYDLGGIESVRAELCGDGSVKIYSGEEHIFTVGVPVMYDDSGAGSSAIDVALRAEEGIIELTYTPDPEWLNSPERTYPVTVDPELCTNYSNPGYAYDTGAYFFYNGDTAYNAEAPILPMGMDNLYYLYFNNIPYVPSGGSLIGASVNITMPYIYFGDCEDATIELSRVEQYWDESTFLSVDPDYEYDDRYQYWGVNESNWTYNFPSVSNTVNYYVDSIYNRVVAEEYGVYELSLELSSAYLSGSELDQRFGFMIVFDYRCSGSVCTTEYSGNTYIGRPRLTIRYAMNYATDLQTGAYYRIYDPITEKAMSENAHTLSLADYDRTDSHQAFKVLLNSYDNTYRLEPYNNSTGYSICSNAIGNLGIYYGGHVIIRKTGNRYEIIDTDPPFRYIGVNNNSVTFQTAGCSWSFEKIASEHLSDEVWYDVGESFCYYKSGVVSSNPNVATVNNGWVTIVGEGTATLSSQSIYCSIVINTVLHSSEKYYLTQGNLCVEPRIGALQISTYDQVGSTPFWQFSHLGQGYYKIIPYENETRCLTAPAGNGDIYVGPLSIGAGNDRQYWRVRYTADGGITLSPKSAPTMYLGLTEDADRAYLLSPAQGDTVWWLVGDTPDVIFLNHSNEPLTVHDSHVNSVKRKLSSEVFGSRFETITMTSGAQGLTHREFLDILDSSGVLFISSHGTSHSVFLHNGSGDAVEMSELDGLDLSNIELVVLMCCGTASGTVPSVSGGSDRVKLASDIDTPQNFFEKLLKQGAKRVVAFTDEIASGDVTEFVGQFVSHIACIEPDNYDQPICTALSVIDGYPGGVNGNCVACRDCWILGVSDIDYMNSHLYDIFTAVS